MFIFIFTYACVHCEILNVLNKTYDRNPNKTIDPRMFTWANNIIRSMNLCSDII